MDEYAKFISDYTLEVAARISGVPVNRLRDLVELYANPKIKVVSFWTMGFNQHTRGVWCNTLVYNIHLLTGKIAEPGNSPFSLTGQPSACGTAREIGTFLAPPSPDMLVANKAHREKTEHNWTLPEGTIAPQPGYRAVLQNRMLRDGTLNAYWIQVNNNPQAAPNANEETYPGYRNPTNFIVVSDAYPTLTAPAADLVLPTAMWVRRPMPRLPCPAQLDGSPAKMQASKEVWGKLFGTISTREKFLDRRTELAEARMGAHESQ